MNPLEPKSIEHHPEWQAQHLAASTTKHGGSAAERDYRRIYAAIAAAPMPLMPEQFAARVLAQIEDLGETAQAERRLLWVLVCTMAIGSLFFVAPVVSELVAPLAHHLSSPWPMMAAAVFAAVVLFDRSGLLQKQARGN